MRSRPVTLYTTSGCPYSERAKRLLRDRRIRVVEVNVTDDPSKQDELMERTERATLPQVMIGCEPTGGYAELRALDRAGELGRRVAGAQIRGL